MRDILLLYIPWMKDWVKYFGIFLMQFFDIYNKYKYPLTQRGLPFSSSLLSSFLYLADSFFSSSLPQPKVLSTGLVS